MFSEVLHTNEALGKLKTAKFSDWTEKRNYSF